MVEKELPLETLENPTLALKVSSLLSKSWNRDLREEQLHQDTINRLKGSPVRTQAHEDKKEPRQWITEQVVQSFDS